MSEELSLRRSTRGGVSQWTGQDGGINELLRFLYEVLKEHVGL